MATGKVSADSSVVVTSTVGGKPLIDVARDELGSPPVVWGRYFTGSATKNSVVYRPDLENEVLHAAGIRLLPIARQTDRVSTTNQHGRADGHMNADAFIDAFGIPALAAAGKELLMFLDVEGPPHSLAASYYRGWASALQTRSRDRSNGKFVIRPAIYATQADDVTWRVVQHGSGLTCVAGWVARWRKRGCAKPLDWDPAIVTPNVPLDFPIVLWQYSDECHGGDGFDCNEISIVPEDERFLLQRLIIPPK